AAVRISEETLQELGAVLEQMRSAADDPEQLMTFDTAFHRTVTAATGNEALVSLLDGLSGRTVRARVWRGLVEGGSAVSTIAEHEAILRALHAHDPHLSHACALLHVNTSDAWLRTVLAQSAG